MPQKFEPPKWVLVGLQIMPAAGQPATNLRYTACSHCPSYCVFHPMKLEDCRSLSAYDEDSDNKMFITTVAW